MVKQRVKQSEIASFVYEGSDSMLGLFSHDTPVPKCHPNFIAQLRLKNGELIDAPPRWRRKIWAWWITERREEVGNNVLRQVANDMLGRNRHA